MDRPYVDWPAQSASPDVVIRGRHRLAETGLFDDEQLMALFDRYDPEQLRVYRMGDDHHKLDEFQLGSRGELTAGELLEAVKAGRLWLNILNIYDEHEGIGQLVDDVYDELEQKVPGFRAVWRSANLLVSSPRAKVYYHADAPANLLWHLRGDKRVWVYPRDERFIPQTWLEKIYTRESDDDLPYEPAFDAHATAYDLAPGEFVGWPHNSPHRVDNLSGLNVSLTTEHYTPEGMRKRNTYVSNRHLRKWFGLPIRSTSIDGPVPLAKRLLFRLARRVPGVPLAVEEHDLEKFSLERHS